MKRKKPLKFGVPIAILCRRERLACEAAETKEKEMKTENPNRRASSDCVVTKAIAVAATEIVSDVELLKKNIENFAEREAVLAAMISDVSKFALGRYTSNVKRMSKIATMGFEFEMRAVAFAVAAAVSEGYRAMLFGGRLDCADLN